MVKHQSAPLLSTSTDCFHCSSSATEDEWVIRLKIQLHQPAVITTISHESLSLGKIKLLPINFVSCCSDKNTLCSPSIYFLVFWSRRMSESWVCKARLTCELSFQYKIHFWKTKHTKGRSAGTEWLQELSNFANTYWSRKANRDAAAVRLISHLTFLSRLVLLVLWSFTFSGGGTVEMKLCAGVALLSFCHQGLIFWNKKQHVNAASVLLINNYLSSVQQSCVFMAVCPSHAVLYYRGDFCLELFGV